MNSKTSFICAWDNLISHYKKPVWSRWLIVLKLFVGLFFWGNGLLKRMNLERINNKIEYSMNFQTFVPEVALNSFPALAMAGDSLGQAQMATAGKRKLLPLWIGRIETFFPALQDLETSWASMFLPPSLFLLPALFLPPSLFISPLISILILGSIFSFTRGTIPVCQEGAEGRSPNKTVWVRNICIYMYLKWGWVCS